MYKDVWDYEIDYKIIPTHYLEVAIDKLLIVAEQEPDRLDAIDDMILDIRHELIRRL